ncbi:right-handed parallel beta-helix repeat-containing protein [Labilibaculum euxinus]
METTGNKFILLLSFISLFFFLKQERVLAQPSGGPYGPIHKSYDLPNVDGTIYYVSPDGSKDAKGLKLSEPTNIESAVERVKTGDVIVLRGGIYRTGNLTLNQGITMQPYKDEQAVIKGTLVATEWEKLKNGLWRTSWSHLFPSKPQDWWVKDVYGKITPLHRFNDDLVFVDGRFLQSVGWEGEVNEDTYFINYETQQVYIGTDPTNKEVEITAFATGLVRTIKDVHGKVSDGIGPVIKGITITQYPFRIIEVEGYYPEGLSADYEHGNDVVGTTIENCTMSYCGRIGVNLIGDKISFKHCKISDTSTEGLYLVSSDDALIEKNIFTRNNIENLVGYFPAAVKIFNQSNRVVFNDNLVIDLPNSNGVWYDVGNVDGRFINNWVEGVGFPNNNFQPHSVWPSRNGFFFEISKGAVCAGNVFTNCDHGILILNSNNVKVYQNTFVNSLACFGRNERSAQGDHFGWHPSTGPDVDERTGHEFVNNLMVKDEKYNGPLLLIWQPDVLCGELKEPALKYLDHNAYVSKNDVKLDIWLSDTKNAECQANYSNPEAFYKQHPEYAKNSIGLARYNGPLFKSLLLGNYELLSDFKGKGAATSLPEEVYQLLQSPVNPKLPFVGAYPFPE